MTHAPVALITGASSGIGLAAAKALAAQGWKIIATGRNPERCAAAREQIIAASSSGDVTMITGNLALLAEARRIATEVQQLTDRLNLLANNAGGMAKEKVITSEGLEENFAANHLGHFVLTRELLPLLQKTAAASGPGSVRVINTASDAGEMIPGFNLEDMQNLQNWNYGMAYCTGKLANVLFTKALGKRVKKDGIVVHAFHPGIVDSHFFDCFDADAKAQVAAKGMQSTEEGASTLIWLATSAEAQENGGYFANSAPREPHPWASDETIVERFWLESEKLVASAEN
ncbi:SDR family NAD(P)-dependent oxidoreductase [Pseudomaricurvus sp. HS19]|uniref:SDR family NAD(P)-dependent oxidoreductase n=1 Tax=Pseudomaricurvus sp. HS19 TaxID=2692626 RepID=UPI0019297C40|nr:SDR family NAD(P)-dependent oxidoreductase [Pseudomaricurvus sp. HS19]